MDGYEVRQATWDEFVKNTYDNYLEWGAPLTPDQYLQREIDTKDVVNGHRPWILFNKETKEIVASCETYSNESYYMYNNNSDTEIHSGVSESVASVFVEAKYRGKGYASTMMTKLSEIFRLEGRIFCDLYSDVDPKVYQKSGWNVAPSPTIKVPKDKYETIQNHLNTNINTTDEYLIEDITIDNYLPILENEKKETFENFKLLTKSNENDNLDYYYGKLFSKENFLWIVTNSKVYARYLNIPTPTVFGRVLKSKENGEIKGYVLWTQDYRDQQLNIVRFNSKDSNQFNLLLKGCIEESVKNNFDYTSIWYEPTLSKYTNTHFKQEYLVPLQLEITNRVNSSIPMVITWIPTSTKNISPNHSSNNNSPFENRKDTFNQSKWINIEKFMWV